MSLCWNRKRKIHLLGRRKTTSCKSYLSILCNAIYPDFLFDLFDFFFIIFLCRLRSLRGIHFWAELHQINQARFYQKQLVDETFAKMRLFSNLRSCWWEIFQVCSFSCREEVVFSVYRAVNTTNSDRGNCCGCKCGSVAVVLSGDLHVTSDWWTKTFACTEKWRRSVSCHTAGTWTLEHHQRCRVINTRLFIIFFLLNYFVTHLNLGPWGDKTIWGEPIPIYSELKEFLSASVDLSSIKLPVLLLMLLSVVYHGMKTQHESVCDG